MKPVVEDTFLILTICLALVFVFVVLYKNY